MNANERPGAGAAAQVVLHVALPTPLPRLFDYYAPLEGVPRVGMRVRVPFGPRQMVGFIAGISRHSDFASTLKTAHKLIDAQPLLPPELWDTLNFAARYYHHSLGEVLNTAVPTALRDGAVTKTRGVPMLRATAGAEIAGLRGPAQRALLALLLAGERSDTELNLAIPGWRAAFAALKRKGLAELWIAESFIPPGLKLAGPPLNAEQVAAVVAIFKS